MIPQQVMEEPEEIKPPAEVPAEPVPGLRQDLAVLMKVRLNFFVWVTTFFGFLLASRGGQLE